MCGASESQAAHLSKISTLTDFPLAALTVYDVPQIGAVLGLAPPPNSVNLHWHQQLRHPDHNFCIRTCILARHLLRYINPSNFYARDAKDPA